MAGIYNRRRRRRGALGFLADCVQDAAGICCAPFGLAAELCAPSEPPPFYGYGGGGSPWGRYR